MLPPGDRIFSSSDCFSLMEVDIRVDLSGRSMLLRDEERKRRRDDALITLEEPRETGIAECHSLEGGL